MAERSPGIWFPSKFFAAHFLTLCLEDRRSDLLVRHIDALRALWRNVGAARPFETVAAVVLPEHMYFLWRLPEDDWSASEKVVR